MNKYKINKIISMNVFGTPAPQTVIDDLNNPVDFNSCCICVHMRKCSKELGKSLKNDHWSCCSDFKKKNTNRSNY